MNDKMWLFLWQEITVKAEALRVYLFPTWQNRGKALINRDLGEAKRMQGHFIAENIIAVQVHSTTWSWTAITDKML